VVNADSSRVPGRLLWRCRRGLKELDVILERFAREGLPGAPAAEYAAFERLLGLPDPEIAGCLLAAGRLEDPSMQALVLRIRDLCHPSPVC
jgi:antitoxin CptB